MPKPKWLKAMPFQFPGAYGGLTIDREVCKRRTMCKICFKSMAKGQHRIVLSWRGPRHIFAGGGSSNEVRHYMHPHCLRTLIGNSRPVYDDRYRCVLCHTLLRSNLGAAQGIRFEGQRRYICHDCLVSKAGPRVVQCRECRWFVMFNEASKSFDRNPIGWPHEDEEDSGFVCNHCVDLNDYPSQRLVKRIERQEAALQATIERIRTEAEGQGYVRRD